MRRGIYVRPSTDGACARHHATLSEPAASIRQPPFGGDSLGPIGNGLPAGLHSDTHRVVLELLDHRAGRIFSLWLALLLTFGCTHQKRPPHAASGADHASATEHVPGDEAGRRQDEEAILAWASTFATAWNQHDATLLASTFAENATLSSVSGRLATGRRAIEQLFDAEQRTSMKATTFAWTDTKVVFLEPDTALFDAECAISSRIESDARQTSRTRFRVTVVLKREEDTWVVHPCMFAPLPTSAALDPDPPPDANPDILGCPWCMPLPAAAA